MTKDRLYDDWMHPRTAPAHEYKRRDPMERPFLIVREKRVICSFSGGRAPTEWNVWSSFTTEAERDDALDKLRATTSWSLRSGRRDPCGGWEFDDYGPAYAMKMMSRLKKARSS